MKGHLQLMIVACSRMNHPIMKKNLSIGCLAVSFKMSQFMSPSDTSLISG